MASIRKEIVLRARAADAWSAVRDVGAAQRLFPGVVAETHLDGDARVVKFANGLVVRELIVDVDDAERRFAYASVGGRAKHHNASIQVFDEGDRCRLVWITDVLPNELAAFVIPLVEQGLAATKVALE